METMKCKQLSGREASAALQQFTESYGGEEAMKKNYPRTYQAYQQALAYEKNTTVTATNETSMEEIPSVTITHVAYTNNKKEQLCIEVACDVENNSNATRQSLCVINRKTQKEVKTEKRDFAGIGNKTDNTLIIPLKGNDINDLHLTLHTQTIGRGITPYQWEGALSDFMVEDTCLITLEHPQKKHPEHKEIEVSFYAGNCPKQTTGDWDYHYLQSWSDKKFRLPSKGMIKTGTKLTGITGCFLKIKKEGKTRFHSNPTPDVFIDPMDKTIIKWNIPENWDFDFRDILGANFNDVAYDLTIIAGSTTGNMTFSITSENSANDTAYRKIIPGLKIYADCFPEGTLVKMQNGSQKRVEDLLEGDMVLCENHQSAQVHFSESAKTRAILGRLVLENGTELTATPGHMIETTEGLISLNLLPAGKLVKTVNGNIRVRHTEILPEKECNIVVVGIQSVHRLYANDILAGDSEVILTEAEKAANIRYQIPEEWRQDYDSMIAGK